MIMPEEYKNSHVNIYCYDCEQQSVAPFHLMGAKCSNCRSYNTVRDKGEIFYVEPNTIDQGASGKNNEEDL